MSRELKRVALDFDWPLKEVWSGYINPHPIHSCKHCDGLGWSKDYKDLERLWYGSDDCEWKQNPHRPNARYNALAWSENLKQEDVDALITADKLWDFTRVPINDEQREIVRQKVADGGNSWLPFNNGYSPTIEDIREWNLKGLGLTSSHAYFIIKARLAKDGKSHLCTHCNGKGVNWQHKTAKSRYNRWKPYDPPTGEGFQLWGNTNEGSPCSPVFESLEDLCEWCETNATTFGRSKASKEEWIQMLTDGFVYHKEGSNIFF